MKSRYRLVVPNLGRLVRVLVLCVWGLDVCAQSDTRGGSPIDDSVGTSVADREWSVVKDLGKPKQIRPAGTDAASVAEAKQNAVVILINEADQLAAFARKNPKHTAAKDAKCMEAIALIEAYSLGDTSQAKRRERLVADIRGDRTIAMAKRARVAATADHTAVSKRSGLTRSQRLKDYEKVVRSLTEEFPEIPDGYASLVNIAKYSPSEDAQKIIRDVLAMGDAPASVKAEAQQLAERFALIGQPAAALAQIALPESNVVASAAGRPIVFYTWSIASPGSIAQVHEMVQRAPATCVFVGVCMDRRDLRAAESRAAAEKLPGVQIYDRLGSAGGFASRLKMTQAGLIYVADSSGAIRSVSGQLDLAETAALIK